MDRIIKIRFQFDYVSFHYVYRELNKRVDVLSKEVLILQTRRLGMKKRKESHSQSYPFIFMSALQIKKKKNKFIPLSL